MENNIKEQKGRRKKEENGNHQNKSTKWKTIGGGEERGEKKLTKNTKRVGNERENKKRERKKERRENRM